MCVTGILCAFIKYKWTNSLLKVLNGNHAQATDAHNKRQRLINLNLCVTGTRRSHCSVTYLSSSPAAALVLHRLARRVRRLRPVPPVQLTLVQVQWEEGNIRDLALMAARLQQQHVPAGDFRQSIGKDAARGARSDHDEVVFSPEVFHVERSTLRVEQVVVQIG